MSTSKIRRKVALPLLALIAGAAGCELALGTHEATVDPSCCTGGGGGTGTTATGTSTSTGTAGCAAGEMDCGGTCTRLDGDHLNCGKCGNVCDTKTPSTSACVGSSCKACDSGTADCDGLGVNACEVDLTSDKKNCGFCGRACVGSCAMSQCQPLTIASGQSFPRALIVGDGSIFWATSDKLLTAPVSGGAMTLVAQDKAPTNSWELALDATDIYWTGDYISRTVISGGGAIEKLTANQPQNSTWLALSAQFLYFTDTAMGTIVKYDLTTKMTSTVVTGQDATTFLTLSGNDLLWATSAAVMKKTLPSGSPSMISPAAYAFYVVADGTNVYWVEGAAIRTAPQVGGTASDFLSVGQPACLVVDETSVYWTDHADHAINKAPKVGGSPTKLATGQADVRALALDKDFVYWTDYFSGTVMKVEKDP
jgi:hypothetical protein